MLSIISNARYIFLTIWCLCATANAAVIHESAILGETGSTGSLGIDSRTFLGSRFSISQKIKVDHVGGHIAGGYLDRPLFAAIVSLSTATALPTGSPFDTPELIANTLFTPPSFDLGSQDILIPMNVTLTPGHYGLIFGSGLFGATGYGGKPFFTDVDVPGSASYFTWGSDQWYDMHVSAGRFVVTGTVVPIPPAVWLFMSGLLGLIGIGRQKKTSQLASA